MSLITFQNKSDGDFLTTNDVNQIKSIVNLHYTSFIAPMQSQIGALYSAGAAENTFTGLNDTPSDFNAGKYLRVNSAGDSIEYADIAGGGGGSTTFVGLSDTPSSFTANKYLRVNSAGDALEYVDIAGGGGGGEEASYISNGTVSGYYDANNNFRYNHHIIPEGQTSRFDIGAAEHKVRHLYLSNNSLWIGDESKISSVDGALKIRQRDKNKLPSYIIGLGGNEEGALLYAEASSVGDLSLADLEGYAKTLDNNADLDKMFVAEGSENFVDEDYITNFNINTDTSNDYQKILIDHSDDKPLTENLPTLDLTKSSSFEFVITDDAYLFMESQYFCKLPCNFKVDRKTHVYKFKVTISQRGYYKTEQGNVTSSSSMFSSPMFAFKIRVNNSSSFDPVDYRFYEYPATRANGQQGAQNIVLDCTLAIDITSFADQEQAEDLLALFTEFGVGAQKAAKLTSSEGEVYYWVYDDGTSLPPEGGSTFLTSSMPDGDFEAYLKTVDGEGVLEVISNNNGQAVQVSDNDINFNIQNHPTLQQDVKVVDSISITLDVQKIFGTLYTDYYYYNNPNGMYGGDDSMDTI